MPSESPRPQHRRDTGRVARTAATEQSWEPQLDALGDYLRRQRREANLSLRELAALTQLSNAYISQLERGRHEPSVRVLRQLSAALDVSVATLLAQAGLFGDGDDEPPPAAPGATEEAIRSDPRLGEQQKEALLAVYRTLVPQP
jgi:transcriptional regulator with XRE-family HTH domain